MSIFEEYGALNVRKKMMWMNETKKKFCLYKVATDENDRSILTKEAMKTRIKIG